MAQAFAKPFYDSDQWRDCRKAYYHYRGGLCERCLKLGLYSPGEIVHHKRHINPENIQDPAILTDFNNLELLCRKCHADEHSKHKKRYQIDAFGRVV